MFLTDVSHAFLLEDPPVQHRDGDLIRDYLEARIYQKQEMGCVGVGETEVKKRPLRRILNGAQIGEKGTDNGGFSSFTHKGLAPAKLQV